MVHILFILKSLNAKHSKSIYLNYYKIKYQFEY